MTGRTVNLTPTRGQIKHPLPLALGHVGGTGIFTHSGCGMFGLGIQEIIILGIIGILFVILITALIIGPLMATRQRQSDRAVTRAEMEELRTEVDRLREEIEHLKRGRAVDGQEGIRAV